MGELLAWLDSNGIKQEAETDAQNESMNAVSYAPTTLEENPFRSV